MAARPLGRRTLLRGELVAGAGSLLVAAKPPRPSHREQTLTLDVACRADTMRLMPVPNATLLVDSPLYGAPFLVEGFVFPAGTIPDGDGWDHTSVTPLGTWLCRGWTTIRDERPEPHVITTQHYHLESLGDGVMLSATDVLVSEGMEGGDEPGWKTTRIVIGGTGRFAGARGEVVQHHLGTNPSAAGPGGAPVGSRPELPLRVPPRMSKGPTRPPEASKELA